MCALSLPFGHFTGFKSCFDYISLRKVDLLKSIKLNLDVYLILFIFAALN